MNSKEGKAIWVIITEVLFTNIPILIITFLLFIKNDILKLFKTTDLSFVSVVLFGQTLIRFISGIAKSKGKKKWQLMAFWCSMIFIMGSIPSIILLVLIDTQTIESLVIYVLQVVWFILSIVVYIIFGTIGQMYLDEEE